MKLYLCEYYNYYLRIFAKQTTSKKVTIYCQGSLCLVKRVTTM